MDHVLLSEDAMPRMEYKPVQAILETVGVKKACRESGQDANCRVREETEGNPNKKRAGPKRSQQVVPFDSQPLCFPIGPNYVIRHHPGDKLTHSPACGKRARLVNSARSKS